MFPRFGGQVSGSGAKGLEVALPKLASKKSAVFFASAAPKEKEYVIADGQGLYMAVMPDGTKLWDFLYTFNGKRRKLAIKGGYPAVSLKAARDEAQGYREMLSRGVDPYEVRKTSAEELQRTDPSPSERTSYAAILSSNSMGLHPSSVVCLRV